jgi:hypothetical protein
MGNIVMEEYNLKENGEGKKCLSNLKLTNFFFIEQYITLPQNH